LNNSIAVRPTQQTAVFPPTDAIALVRRAFGDPTPLAIDGIWQKPFDYDTAHLHRLAVLSPDASAEPEDLVAYGLDFKYEQIQKDLFLHVLPFCLRAWHDDLTSPFGRYEAFVDEFYPALLRGGVFDGVLNQREAAAVGDYMREAILAQIADYERGDLRARLRRHHGERTERLFERLVEVWTAREPGASYGLEEYVARVRCPVLAIQGEDDEFFTRAQLDALARLLPGGLETLRIPGCGHYPMHQARAEVLAASIAFVLRASGRRSPRAAAGG